MPTEPIQLDYIIAPQTPAPPDYPFEPTLDEYSVTPFLPAFQERRRAFLDFIIKNPAPTNPKAPWFELARLAAGGTPHEGIFMAALDYIDARKDCADFALHALLRLLYQFHGEPKVDPHIYDRIQQSLLSFKYWPDEPGNDSMCTWTENHYILFSTGYRGGTVVSFRKLHEYRGDWGAVPAPPAYPGLLTRFFTGSVSGCHMSTMMKI
jgi:hypothetical protein